MNDYIQLLEEEFTKHANASAAESMKKYMKNKFDFFGIKTPLRRKICKDFIVNPLPPYENLNEIIHQFWQKPEREFHYFAIELLGNYKKTWQPEIIQLFEEMIVENSWWDSVDPIASNLIGSYFLKFPDQTVTITEKWMASGNMWLQRSCIIFQLSYKNQTNTKLLFSFIRQLSHSKEFFIQKAIGWALRQYARTNPAAVSEFVQNHELKPLSVREALKHL